MRCAMVSHIPGSESAVRLDYGGCGWLADQLHTDVFRLLLEGRYTLGIERNQARAVIVRSARAILVVYASRTERYRANIIPKPQTV
jgi:hypothetical protein